jgi:hypothetical protein
MKFQSIIDKAMKKGKNSSMVHIGRVKKLL